MRGSSVAPTPLDHASLARAGAAWADSRAPRAAWREALALGEQHGYRNAQVSVVAPTGTIGLVMDCDTTGIEPDFALVKHKKLAGGGYFKIINRAVPEALRALGYHEAHIAEIEAYAVGHASLGQAPGINHAACAPRASPTRRSPRSRRRSRGAFDIALRLQQMDARRRFPHRRAENPGREDRGAGLRPPDPARLHESRDRGREQSCLRRDDARGRAVSQARAFGVFDCANPAGARASAISRSRATSG